MPLLAAAQAPAQKPSFEVATVKPSRPEEHRAVLINGRRFITAATSVEDLIMFVYEIQVRQIANGPQWLEREKYDVTALPAGEGQPNRQEVRLMVQSLLAERFSLTFHREKRELSIFRIETGKTEPKLKNAANPDRNPGVGFGPGVITVGSATISDFAEFLQRYLLDRPIVDRTGLVGKYDFTLNWTPNSEQTPIDQNTRAVNRSTSDFPDFFTAIQEQLGLRLESAKGPIEVLVIDSVRKPSEN